MKYVLAKIIFLWTLHISNRCNLFHFKKFYVMIEHVGFINAGQVLM